MRAALFQQIKEHYDAFYTKCMKQGKLPMWSTSKGFWSPAALRDVFSLFEQLQLDRYKNFLDMGSGDGSVVATASLFTNATGVEIDKELIDQGYTIAKKLLLSKANYFHGDFFNLPFSQYDIIFWNPDTPSYRGLEAKFAKELKGHLLIFGDHFHPQKLRMRVEFALPTTTATLYSK